MVLGTDGWGEVEDIKFLVGEILFHSSADVVQNILIQGLIPISLKSAHHSFPVRVVQLQVVI